MSGKISIAQAPLARGTRYPPPYDVPCRERERRRLGAAAGLTQFGVNLLRLPPGAWSSQRHWHRLEDEFIYVVEGELVLVTETGEEPLHAGDCAGFRAGASDAHHLQNRSDRDALCLEIGTRTADPRAEEVFYPGIDLHLAQGRFVHADGSAYSDGAAPPAPAPRADPAAR